MKWLATRIHEYRYPNMGNRYDYPIKHKTHDPYWGYCLRWAGWYFKKIGDWLDSIGRR